MIGRRGWQKADAAEARTSAPSAGRVAVHGPVDAHKVAGVRYFRHPPLLGACVILAALAAVLACSLLVGRGGAPGHAGLDRYGEMIAVQSYRSAAADLLTLAETPDHRLGEWAKATSALAAQAAATAERSRGHDDQLTRLWHRAAQSAAALAEVDTADRGAVLAARDRVLADADDLAALTAAGASTAPQPTGLIGDLPYDDPPATTAPPATPPAPAPSLPTTLVPPHVATEPPTAG